MTQMDILKEKLRETGFKITGHDIIFHGICSECIKKETEND